MIEKKTVAFWLARSSLLLLDFLFLSLFLIFFMLNYDLCAKISPYMV